MAQGRRHFLGHANHSATILCRPSGTLLFSFFYFVFFVYIVAPIEYHCHGHLAPG
jgi:hypothetical protein